MNETRQYLIGSMPRALETNAGIANFLQTADSSGSDSTTTAGCRIFSARSRSRT